MVNGSTSHVGTSVGLAHIYHGDGVSSDGVYYWDEATQSIKSDMVDDMFSPECKVDASAEVMEKARLFMVAKIMSYIPTLVAEVNAVRAGDIRKGDRVRVVKGRKVPKGTEGTAFWIGSNHYGTSVGVALSDRKDDRGRFADVQFIAWANLEVANPPTYTLTEAQIASLCTEYSSITYWESLYNNLRYGVYRMFGEHPVR